MMEIGDLLRFLPVFCMIAVIVLMRVLTSWEVHRRQRAEIARLRRALRLELGGIRALLDENLRQLAAQSTHVFGARGLFIVLRGQAGQLPRLSEAELAAVLAAHAANERLEALLALRGKPGTPGAYRLPAEDQALAEIGRATLATMAALDAALACLSAPAANSLPPASGETSEAEIALALTPATPVGVD
jgi:hypothetical protein